MPTEIMTARPEIVEIGREVRKLYHPHLTNAQIRYLERAGTWRSKGKTVGGTAALATPKECALAGAEINFVITINADLWDKLPDQKRRALMDHELCHCTVELDEEGYPQFKITGHDVEDFIAVIERHGAWNEGLEELASQMRQLDLFDQAPLRAVG